MTVPKARPADPGNRGVVEYHQVDPGQWVVVVYGLIPKNGFGHLDFPHFWGDPAERPVWRVARTGKVPGGTFLFESREQAVEIVSVAFPDQSQMFRYMGRIEVPSLDNRRAGHSGT